MALHAGATVRTAARSVTRAEIAFSAGAASPGRIVSGWQPGASGLNFPDGRGAPRPELNRLPPRLPFGSNHISCMRGKRLV